MTDYTAIAAAMSQGMDGENRRRELASQMPGHGAPMPMPQPPSACGVGLSDMALPVVGEGYEVQSEIAAAVHKAYGPPRPQYADPFLGGPGYPAGTHQPVLRHVSDLGADGLLVEPYGDGRQPGSPYTVISPPAARTSLLRRLAARLRRN